MNLFLCIVVFSVSCTVECCLTIWISAAGIMFMKELETVLAFK